MIYKKRRLLFILTFLIFSSKVFGISIIPANFTLEDGSVTGTMLNDFGAVTGQILFFDGSEWVTDDMDGLTFVGNWDAANNNPDLNVAGNVGDFYIVTSAGNTILTGGGPGTDTWAPGDWVVWNHIESRWDKIMNASNAISIHGRSGEVTPGAGDYSWNEIDKTISTLGDIADVDSSTPAANQILLWDNTKWKLSTDAYDTALTITASLPLVYATGASPTISINQANNSNDGYLSSSDWNNFNNKQDSFATGSSAQYLKGDSTLGTLNSDIISITLASFATAAGTVTASDSIINTINKLAGNIEAKESTLLKGNLTETNSNILTITNGTNAVMGTGTTIEVIQADASNSGYISNSNWSTFNSKLSSPADGSSGIGLNTSNQLEVIDGGIVSSKLSQAIEIKNSNYTVTVNDSNKSFLITGNSIITLPPAASAGAGFLLTIKNVDASNRIIIDADGTEAIDGREISTLESQYSFETLVSDGNNWYIIAQGGTLSYCPTNFVAVPGNETLGTADFCVMKYEAKNSGGVPVSSPIGSPWVSIDANDSFAACESISHSGFNGNFSLISNSEWMTIARNIESIGTNWSEGLRGNGNLARGWSARTADDGFENLAVAPSTGTSCLYNTNTDSCGSEGTHKLRRTHQLSNGSELWDFAGNVNEWVDWDDSVSNFTLGPTDATNAASMELSVLDGSVNTGDLQSSYGFTSSQQAGRWIGGTDGAAIRGNKWSSGDDTGIFALSLNNLISLTDSSIGFRCVYRP